MIDNAPVAYSQRYYEKMLISANRFLGLPNSLWSLIATVMLGLTGWFASGLALSQYLGDYAVWLAGLALSLWLLLKCLTPRRRRLKRLALQAHRDEVLRIAAMHAIDPTSIRVVDSEEERRALESGEAFQNSGHLS